MGLLSPRMWPQDSQKQMVLVCAPVGLTGCLYPKFSFGFTAAFGSETALPPCPACGDGSHRAQLGPWWIPVCPGLAAV